MSEKEKQIKAVIVAIMLVIGAISTVNSINYISATTEGNESTEENEEQAIESQNNDEPTYKVDETPTPAFETPQEAEENAKATGEKNEEQAIESNNDIEPCLLDPSLDSCPKPDPDQNCPEGWAQNEDGNCFPLHPEGCPSGYHSHEDDETGRCIPNSTPCEPGYVLITENKPSCLREEYACQEYPNTDVCKDDNGNSDNGKGNNGNGHGNNGDENSNHNDKDDHKKQIIIKNIHNTNVVKKIVEADDDLDLEQAIVAISYNEGAGIVCVFADDNEAQCETFDVTKDSGKEPLLQIIPFN